MLCKKTLNKSSYLIIPLFIRDIERKFNRKLTPFKIIFSKLAFLFLLAISSSLGMEKIENTETRLKSLAENFFRGEISFYAYSWHCLHGGSNDTWAVVKSTISKYKPIFAQEINLILLDPSSGTQDIQNLFKFPDVIRTLNRTVGQGNRITIPEHFFNDFATEVANYVNSAIQESFNTFCQDKNFPRALLLANAYHTKSSAIAEGWERQVIEDAKPTLNKLAKESKLLSILDPALAREKDIEASTLIEVMPQAIRESLTIDYAQQKERIPLPRENEREELRILQNFANRLFGNNNIGEQ